MVRLADVRRDERPAVIGAFLTLFGMMAGHVLTETARDAMFLAKLPAHHLAIVYLAIAGFSIVLTPIEQRILHRFGGPIGLSVLLLGGAAMLLVFYSMTATGTHYTFIALYIYASLFITLVTVHFWVLLGFRYTVTQAKRLFGFIAAGSVVGAVVGSALARALTQVFGPRQLLLAGAGFLVLAAVGPPLSLRTGRTEHHARRTYSFRENLPILRDDPFLRRVAVLVLASTVVFTLTDYVFKSVVSHHVPGPQLGRFFAMVYTVLNVAALVTQLGIVSWLIRTVGVTRALAVLPVLLLLGAGGVVAGGGMAAVILLKGADGGLRYSLHRTGVELLYVPIADSLRARLKTLVDGVGQRAGQAVGSVVILVVVRFFNDSETVVAGVIVALSAVWLLGVSGLRQHYLDLFRGTLARGAPVGHVDLPALDVRALESLIASLNSPDDRDVLATLDLLAAQERVNLVPALILYHPSNQVVLRALELLSASRRTDHLPLLSRLCKHADPEIRAAALAALIAIDPSTNAMSTALQDPSPIVRATALVELVSAGHHLAAPELGRVIDELPDWPEAACLAFVRGIRRRPSSTFATVLHVLAGSSNPAVRAEVATAMGELKNPMFIPDLLPMLGDASTRPKARTALLGLGEPALSALDVALGDPETPVAVRRHLPRTISRFDPELAAPLLLGHLGKAHGMVRYKILRGLGRLVHEHPDLPLDRDLLLEVAVHTLDTAFTMLGFRVALGAATATDASLSSPGHDLIALLLANKESLAVERVFRLLDLLHPREDFERIYRGLGSEDAALRASSRELIDYVVDDSVREAVFALVDDIHDSDRLARGGRKIEATPTEYPALLVQMLSYPSVALRSLVAHHIGELGLVELRPALVAARPSGDGAFAAVFARALARIDAATTASEKRQKDASIASSAPIAAQEVPRAG